MELYVERGFDQATVAEIARRAGLTERTFFRHYADKREVLFRGSEQLQEALAAGIAEAPAAAGPLAAVLAGFAAAATFFDGRREFVLQRQRVVSAYAELRERELVKLSVLADAAAAALRERGVEASAAQLAGHTGVTVFHVAFARWVAEDATGTFAETLQQTFAELGALAGSG